MKLLLNKDSGNISWELHENYDINSHQHDEERWMMSVPWDKHRVSAYHSNAKPLGLLGLAGMPWQWQLSHWMTRWCWGSTSGSGGWGQGRRLLPASEASYLQQPRLQALKTRGKPSRLRLNAHKPTQFLQWALWPIAGSSRKVPGILLQ